VLNLVDELQESREATDFDRAVASALAAGREEMPQPGELGEAAIGFYANSLLTADGLESLGSTVGRQFQFVDALGQVYADRGFPRTLLRSSERCHRPAVDGQTEVRCRCRFVQSQSSWRLTGQRLAQARNSRALAGEDRQPLRPAGAVHGLPTRCRNPDIALATSGTAERVDHIWRLPGGQDGFVQVSVAAADIVTADVLAAAIVGAGHPHSISQPTPGTFRCWQFAGMGPYWRPPASTTRAAPALDPDAAHRVHRYAAVRPVR
jgi:hypothetical protein